jgi:hypothetical protein
LSANQNQYAAVIPFPIRFFSGLVLELLMQHAFAIKSTRSDAELAFTNCEGDYFTVELCGREISAVRRVWGYTDYCQNLVELLDYLAKQDRGWAVPAEWASIELELVLRWRSDLLGHVFVEIEMSHNGGEDWRLKAEIETELGQLPRIAREAALFFRS